MNKFKEGDVWLLKFENTEVWGLEHAIRRCKAKGYRERNGVFETFVSVDSKTMNLGTYHTKEDAKQAIIQFRIKRFLESIHKDGLNECDCVVTHDNYVVFKTGEIYNLYGKEISGHIDRCGYKEVMLNNKQCRVHRIVAETFIPNPDNKKCVNHIDGNKLNNCFNNLEWVTHSENTLHAYRIGLEKKYLGENHPLHKLTQKEVEYIKRVYIKRNKQYGAVPLSKRFNVDRTTIYDIVNNRTWRI